MAKLQGYVWLGLLQGNGWLGWRWVVPLQGDGWPWLICRKGGPVAGRWVTKLQGQGWLSCLSHAYTYAHTCTQVTCSFYLHKYTPARITVDCDEYYQSLWSHYTVQWNKLKDEKEKR